ncbi:hypothetical protein HYV49_00685 [Candidatus Pacearchaeota archaeon]|nr:hypothetical protein [Candidatus Pacearchaeota archaeon]
MPHKCVHCARIYPNASRELLEGCACGSKFFLYVREDQLNKVQETEEKIIELVETDKEKVEQEIREMIGASDDDAPIILDLESVRVLGHGKFQIDIINLFRKDRPLIYKLEEGKYIIDIASTLMNIKDKKA